MSTTQTDAITKAAKSMIDQLPSQYIDDIIANHSMVLPVEKPTTRKKHHEEDARSHRKAIDIENAAIHARNIYMTSLIREELIRLRKAQKK